jgi:hypothetical protein
MGEGVSRSTIMRVVKSHGFHPYRLQIKHGLLPEDYGARVDFAEDELADIAVDRTRLSWMIFSDEALFHTEVFL